MATRYVTCPNCHTQNPGVNARCLNCGTAMPVAPSPMQQYPQQQGAQIPGAEKKLAAGLCGILLGGFGVHKFILGYQQEGIILLAVTLVAWIVAFASCGILFFLPLIPGIIGIVEGIIYLTKSDEDFVNTYIVNKKPWF